MLVLGQQLLDALDIRNESHIQHAVRFIKYQHVDVLKVYGSLLTQIQQATRGRYKYVDTLTQFLDLWSYLDAAKHSQ